MSLKEQTGFLKRKRGGSTKYEYFTVWIYAEGFSGILLAVITPCIGITIVLKRMSMIGDALSHSSLAGVVLGLILGVNPVAGAVVMCIVAALGIEAIRKKIPR